MGPPVLFALFFLLTALFPRVPTYNPILVTKGDGIPCKIYGESPYPTRTAERKFPLAGIQNKSFTISTLEPAPSFSLEFENNEPRSFNFTVSNFDRHLKEVEALPGKTRTIEIENPRYKKFGNRYFYRFHIQARPPIPANASLFVQLYTAGNLPY
jgi:hypothetical protein